ncbi:unnamed protein product [Mytilus coruscus]|uniref:Uncharacterized protein n=1 Tax=Mytilus coruscus TaxID=42192 RepID=A0A6J8C020_MYTCO|nr:unnamed protein product [Mytilus coruscus]
MYTWSVLILNVFRYKLLGKLNSTQDQTCHKKTSKKCILFLTLVLSLISAGYAVNLHLNKSLSSKNIIFRVLDVLAKDAAFMISTLLNIITIAGVYKVRSGRINSIRPSTRPSAWHDAQRSSILLRQFMLALIFQIVFYVIPCILLNVSEFITHKELHYIGEMTLVLLTPCAFGILAEPRRGFLLEFLCLIKSSEHDVPKLTAERNNTQGRTESTIQRDNRTKNVPDSSINLPHSNELPMNVTSIGTDTKIQEKDIKTDFEKHSPSRQYFTDLTIKNGTPKTYSIQRYIKPKKSTDISIISGESDTSVFGSFSDICSTIQRPISRQGRQDCFIEINQRRGRSISTIIQRKTPITTLMQRDSSISDVLSIM